MISSSCDNLKNPVFNFMDLNTVYTAQLLYYMFIGFSGSQCISYSKSVKNNIKDSVYFNIQTKKYKIEDTKNLQNGLEWVQKLDQF